LKSALLEAAQESEVEIYKIDQYGTHYDLKFSLTTVTGASLVLSCWVILSGEDYPRLTNVYPVDK
jgi:hypothetical protein